MKYDNLILEKKEYVYLKRILNISGYSGDHQTQQTLMKLSEELKTATIIDDSQMPDDVIRFNSIASLVFDNGIEKTLQVVIPADKDVSKNKISILTPMGSALIGYSKDDLIEWDFPKGKLKIKITSVTQEETFSDFDTVV